MDWFKNSMTQDRENDDRADMAVQEWGSDYIIDILNEYGFEFVSFNPGASFRGLEESIVNYKENSPEVIEVPNESLSVSVAHGYAKASGKPGLCILHNAVGTLNGSMGIWNAYVDNAPVLILGGNGPLRKSERRPWIDWNHTTLDQAALVREILKWDDQPAHIDGVAESLVRAYNISTTKPKGPVYVTIDHDLQENQLRKPLPLPNLDHLSPPGGLGPDPESLEEATRLLLQADNPVILAGAVGETSETVESLIELAETLGAPVIDTPKYHRFNFPNTHPLSIQGRDACRDADVLLALDVRSLDYVLKQADTQTHEIVDAIEVDSLIKIDMGDVEASSLTADYCEINETDLSMVADTQFAIPMLCDVLQSKMSSSDLGQAEKRRKKWGELHDRQREEFQSDAEDAWGETPIAIPRIVGELWDIVSDEDWVIVNDHLRKWTHRLWEIEEFDQYIGGYSGGGGVGYGIGAAIGGALAYGNTSSIPINFQADGDLMQFLGALWTLGHYEIPLLTIVHNNGTLYNSTNHRIQLATYRERDASFERALIGTGLQGPRTDFAQAADSMGVNGYGPIEDPSDLAPALHDAWSDVVNGTPALVDVVAQSR